MNPSSIQPATIINAEVVTLIPWADRYPGAFGHDPRSVYVEQYWLGTLGPSTTWFLRHCASLLENGDRVHVNLRDTANALGIGFEGGARSAMVKTVARACRFRAARHVGSTTLAVRLRLPMLSRGQLQRLPKYLQQRHAEYVTAAVSSGAILREQPRARQVALSLVECGDGIGEAEVHLGRLRFHPAIAAEAARWAWGRHHGPIAPEAA